jgi:hypothetical protein
MRRRPSLAEHLSRESQPAPENTIAVWCAMPANLRQLRSGWHLGVLLVLDHCEDTG